MAKQMALKSFLLKADDSGQPNRDTKDLLRLQRHMILVQLQYEEAEMLYIWEYVLQGIICCVFKYILV